MVLLNKKPLDDEALMRDYGDEIEALVEALLMGEEDVDLKLAELVENVPHQVRVAIVEKMREMVAARDEEKAKQLDKSIEQQKLLEKQSKSLMMQAWLANVMSQETLRKIREAFMANPQMQKDLDGLGHDLAKKGVLQNMQPSNKQELGELTAQVQHQQKRGEDKGQGRG